MPKKILPDGQAFSQFRQRLADFGYRELSREEFVKIFQRLGLEAPRPQPGREVGFIFTANDLKVYVWTTYLDLERRARDSDAGWVVIVEGDSARYFSHPMRRTKNFLSNLAKHAWIAQWRVVHRPLCSKCKRYMKISYGRAMKSRYWSCKHNKDHDNHKPVFLPWDFGMPPKALALLKRERKARARYRKARTKAGKPNNVAMKLRADWKRIRPQNSIQVTSPNKTNDHGKNS